MNLSDSHLIKILLYDDGKFSTPIFFLLYICVIDRKVGKKKVPRFDDLAEKG